MSESLVLAPLDGSDLSEKALPYATALAEATDAGLLLLTVWGGADGDLVADLPAVAEDLNVRAREHYQEYLAGVAKRLEGEGVRVETEVSIGNPAEEILRAIAERDPRLLVMATHGRSGLSRWVYGSVASKLAREAPVPTLMVGPRALEDQAPPSAIRRILVPLDASPLAESALAPALELAKALQADVLLAQVLSWTSQAYTFGVPEVDVAQVDRQLTEAAEQYVGRVMAGLRTERKVEAKVLHGMPADALTGLVEAENIDLVVMASHTRAGLARAVLGSVADRMLQGKAPVLLIRPEGMPAVVHAPRGRYCHNCGRASLYIEVTPEDRCLRCGQHLHACGNCVYYDGVGCMLQRPEVHDTYPGLNCPYFQFRVTEAPAKAGQRPIAKEP